MSSPGSPRFDERVPDGDDRLRRVCADCGFIDYVNPRVVVGVVAARDGRVLMCRRAIEPRRGFWTVPAGFLEVGESTADGALRECREEAGVSLTVQRLLGVYNVASPPQVQLFYSAELGDADPRPGVESLEVGLFRPGELDPEELAFPSVGWILDCHERAAHAPGARVFHHPPD